jgi:hypothetical protein
MNNDPTIHWLPSVEWLLTEYFTVVSEIHHIRNQPEPHHVVWLTPEQREAMYEEIMRNDSDEE